MHHTPQFDSRSWNAMCRSLPLKYQLHEKIDDAQNHIDVRASRRSMN